MPARLLVLTLLLTVFAASDVSVPAEAVDKRSGKPTDPASPGGRLPGPKAGGQVAQCTQSHCAGVMQELGWKCNSVAAVPSSGGYCECQCRDQNGAVTSTKTTSPQHQPAGGGGGYKP